ncbi:MAG: hypothetical protein CSA81_05065 [Acidobacteria bacterium]|nr:MAG: hypothetical protein CSA81_05065 [Acidobacteriota bacterium]PIE91040.1 MAG: hypothetical protein CR997_02670 [Acidobacteriota bacterium]
MSYQFREIEPPSFTLKSGVTYALFLTLLLFLVLDQTNALEFRISTEELEQLKREQQELRRDMRFRFVESPEDEVKPKEDVPHSDATRIAKSMTNEEMEPENEDPFSKGDTFELKQRNDPSPEPSSGPQTKMEEAVSQPLPLPAVPMEKPQEQPKEIEEPEKDDRDMKEKKHVAKIGQLPTWSGAPKPYQPPTKEDLEKAHNAAEKAMSKQTMYRNKHAEREMRQHDNLQGKAMPNIGFSVDTAGHDLGPYLKRFIELVRGNWRIPNIARLEASGVNTIEFKLHQNGSITEAHILTDSGFEALDISSLNAIVNTHPAPPLPAHIEEEWIPIKFGFYYNVRPPR